MGSKEPIKENICRFVPGNPIPDVIRTLHFVYETNHVGEGQLLTSAYAKACLVTEGTATVQSGMVRKEVRRGDLFFILPAVPYLIEGDGDFCYLYISYIGLRGSVLAERLNITAQNFCFPDFSSLEPLWWQGIAAGTEFSDLVSESVLLRTLAAVGERTAENREKRPLAGAENFLQVKRYLEEHFSDPALSLERLAVEFSYNKKYLSASFKKYFKLGVTEYLHVLRINQACTLMEEGYRGIGDIALLCGFRDALYFSKVFRRHMRVSPKEYLKQREL